MKTLGLIGGTSWESTVEYYRLLNQGVRQRLGGMHSCRMLLSSVDFAEFVPLLQAGDWDGLSGRLILEAKVLQRAGADIIVLCTNTMHKVAPAINAAINLPFLDIRLTCAKALLGAGCRKPLLLGTRYTMADDFFTAYLAQYFGVEAQVPSAADQEIVDRIIFDELVKGTILPASKARYLDILARADGADSVILGCTEIGMLLSQADCTVPVFDNMRLHVEAALDFALEETST